MRTLTCAICTLALLLSLTGCGGEDPIPPSVTEASRSTPAPVETRLPTASPSPSSSPTPAAPPVRVASPAPTVGIPRAEQTLSVSRYHEWWESTMRDAELAADTIAGQMLAMADDPKSIRTRDALEQATLACGKLQQAGMKLKYKAEFPPGYEEINERANELGEVFIVLAQNWLIFVKQGDEESALRALDAVIGADPLIVESRRLVAEADERRPSALTLEMLRDASYELPGGDATVDERHVASGDLDGDGLDDAAVVLEQAAPAGFYRHLAIVVNRDGRPAQIATVELGYQTEVYSLEIASGQVTAWLLTHRHGEPRESVSLPARRSYRLVGAGVEIGSVGTSSEDEDRSIVDALVPYLRANTAIPDFTVAITGRDGEYLRVAIEPIGMYDPVTGFLKREGSGWKVLHVGIPAVSGDTLVQLGIPESLRAP